MHVPPINLVFTFISTNNFIYLDLQLNFFLFNEDKIRGPNSEGKHLYKHPILGWKCGYRVSCTYTVLGSIYSTTSTKQKQNHQISENMTSIFRVKILKPTDQFWNLHLDLHLRVQISKQIFHKHKALRHILKTKIIKGFLQKITSNNYQFYHVADALLKNYCY